MPTTKKAVKKAAAVKKSAPIKAETAPEKREYSLNTSEQTFVDGLNADVSRAEIGRTQSTRHFVAYLIRERKLNPALNWQLSEDGRRLVVAEQQQQQQTMPAGSNPQAAG